MFICIPSMSAPSLDLAIQSLMSPPLLDIRLQNSIEGLLAYTSILQSLGFTNSVYTVLRRFQNCTTPYRASSTLSSEFVTVDTRVDCVDTCNGFTAGIKSIPSYYASIYT